MTTATVTLDDCPQCQHTHDFPYEWCDCGMTDSMKAHLAVKSNAMIKLTKELEKQKGEL